MNKSKEKKESTENSPLKQYKENGLELISVVRLGDETAVREFLRQGWNPNVKNDLGITPALEAARRNDLKLLKILITEGAELDVKSALGYTPLAYARKHNNQEMIDIINSTLQKRAKPS